VLRAYAGGSLFGTLVGQEPPTVVALHGWGRTGKDLVPLLDGLDGVAFDLPGFGASPPPPEAWGAADYAACVAAALEEAVGEGRGEAFTVVGHSFGGRVAVCLAERRPDLVRGLVLTGVPLVRLAEPRRPPLGYRLVKGLRRLRLVSEDRLESARHHYGSADYRAASGVMRAVLVRVVNESYDRQLASLACPVELVWGEGDQEAPVTVAERAVDLIPNAELTVVPGAGHDLHRQQPGALRAAIEHLREAAST
jgi:pimeloyl-ACP methyl ester carboxylesterase